MHEVTQHSCTSIIVALFVFIPLDLFLGVEFLGHRMGICLTFSETAKEFPKVFGPLVPHWCPTGAPLVTYESQLLHCLASAWDPVILCLIYSAG